jgi:hypothetical protein
MNGESKIQNILDTPYPKYAFRFSPDGKWVAYYSSESGTPEVFVASFPGFAQKKQVSSGGGYFPEWRGDGKAVFFQKLDGTLMTADIRTSALLEVGSPKQLFQLAFGLVNHFAVTRDGRFLVSAVQQQTTPSETIMLLNWPAALR